MSYIIPPHALVASSRHGFACKRRYFRLAATLGWIASIMFAGMCSAEAVTGSDPADGEVDKLVAKGINALLASYQARVQTESLTLEQQTAIGRAHEAFYGCSLLSWNDDRNDCHRPATPDDPEASVPQLREQVKQLDVQIKNSDDKSKSEAALSADCFRQAARLQPRNNKWPLYEAFALNAQGHYNAALVSINKAVALGYPKENGYVYAAHADAVIHNPGATIGEMEAGLAEMNKAVELLAATPGVPPAYLAGFRHQQALAAAKVSGAQRRTELTLWTRSQPGLSANSVESVPAPREFPLDLSVYSGVGFNDNITKGRPHRLNKGGQVHSANFNESSLTLGYFKPIEHLFTWDRNRKDEPAPGGYPKDDNSWLPREFVLTDQLAFNYTFLADTYNRVHQSDTLLQVGSASYQHAFTPWLSASVLGTDSFRVVEQDTSTNNFAGQIGLNFIPHARATTQLTYTATRQDAFNDPAPNADQDGFLHAVALTETLALLEDPEDEKPALTLSLAYTHQWSILRGLKTRNENDDYLARLRYDWRIHNAASFVRSASLIVSEDWTPTGFDEDVFPRSGKRGAPGTFSRDDETNKVSVTLSVKMWYDKAVPGTLAQESNRLEFYAQYINSVLRSDDPVPRYTANSLIGYLRVNY